MSDPTQQQPQPYPQQPPVQPQPQPVYQPQPGYPPPGTYAAPAPVKVPRTPEQERKLYGLIVLVAGWVAAGATVLATILALAEKGSDGIGKFRSAMGILSGVAFAALALTAGVWLRQPPTGRQ